MSHDPSTQAAADAAQQPSAAKSTAPDVTSQQANGTGTSIA